MNIINTGNQQ